MNNKHEVLFVSHGGGPLPLLGDLQHLELVEQLKEITQHLRQPKAILVISAHWETDVATVTSAARPGLLYDYYGFAAEAYEIDYPVSGHPELAQDVVKTLISSGIEACTTAMRGLDHGVFVPLKLMYPAGNMPVVQLSLNKNLDAEQHITIGKALQSLECENLLILGSGFSFHNMKAFFAPQTEATEERNLAFEHWLKDTLTDTKISEAEREGQLIHWEDAPEARFCHPREEHLLPLHVCYGAAQRAADHYSMARTLGRTAGLFHWRADCD